MTRATPERGEMPPSPAAPLLEYLMRPLEPWLEDPATEDIAINRPDEAWVYQHGAWGCNRVPFDYEELESIAILAGALRQQDVGPESPLLDEKLPDGERLCVCLPPAVPHGTISLTLRKHQDTVVPLSEVNDRYRTEHWAEWRSERTVRNLDRPMAAYAAGDFENFLRVAVEEHLNILFAGPTGVGKTTLGKSVIDAIDRSERVITIEDTEELGGLPPNHVRLLYARHDAGFGHEALLQTTMRMRPKRIILGELRDDAAMTWVKYICTGHPGAVTTIHGSSAGEAFRRLYQLVKSTPDGVAIDDKTLLGMLADAIDVIIPLREIGAGPKSRGIGAVWFAGDARRRGSTIARDLFEGA
jgi:type IV secretion system protein VirB11